MKEINNYENKFLWINILFFSFFINILISSGVLYHYNLGGEIDISRFLFYMEILSIFISYIFFIVHKRLINFVARGFKNNLNQLNRKYNLLFFPLVFIISIAPLYYIFTLKPINLRLLYLVLIPLTIIYFIYAYIRFSKLDRFELKNSIYLIAVSSFLFIVLIIILLYGVSDSILEIYSIIGQYQSLRSGTWGIG